MTGTPVPKAHAPIEAPKGMAVFLCRCNGAVSSVIDLEVLRAMADSDPNVRSVDVMQCCCGEEDKDRVRLALRSDDLDRFLVAGCSFRSMGERFRSLAVESGINASMLEMCNLKEQCAAVHRGVPAQRKAERLFSASLKRCAMLQPTNDSEERARFDNAMVIGNGRSALVSARELLMLGHEVMLLNPNEAFAQQTTGEDVIDPEEGSLDGLVGSFGGKLTISASTQLRGLKGRAGCLTATVDTPLGETDLECGALLLAMDTEAARNPLADLFGEDCIDQDGLEQRLRQGMRPKGRLVMLAMDASGESAFDPMSTHEAVHNALFVKGVSPNCEVSIITREIFALGQCEAGYRKAQGSGVRIVRTDRMPGRDGPDTLRVHDVHLGQDILLRYDLMVLDNATTIPDMISMCKVIGLPCDLQGRPSRPNAKLLPSSSQREGVYLCGTAIERSLGIGPTLQAKASAAKMSAMLRSPIHRNGDVAQVYSEKCSACLTCVRSCPYSAPYMNPENKAAVNEDLCQGCGLCVSLCPSKALQQLSYRDDQMEAQIEMALGGSVMKVIAFTCSYCGYSAADLAGLEGREYSADVIINRLPCTGRLEQRHVLRAFREGADGVLVFGCLEGNCNFHYGNIEARKRVTAVRELMSMLGLGPERLEMCNVASNQSFRFVEIVEEMEKRLERIGPSPVNKVRS